MESPSRTPSPTRRSLLRSTGLLGLAAVPGAALLSGCATGGSGSAATSGAAGSLTVNETAALEVVSFAGGYGQDYAKYDVSLYKTRHPKANVSLSGIQDIKDQLQSRFVGGNPPDVLDNSGGSKLPLATLVSSGQVADLSPLLAAPSLDDASKTVAGTILPGSLDAVMYDGKPRALPYVYTAYGFWYSEALFQQRGWQWPTTWADMLTLAGEMKGAGMAPFAYGGTTAPDYWLPPLFSLAVKEAGIQVVVDVDNLKPNAWLADPMQQAAAAIADLASKGYFLSGSEGLSHTQAQTAWVQGKAGVYPSGSWIENEMKSITPDGYSMTFGAIPLLDSNAKLPVTALYAGASETYLVPAQAKNLNGGLEYLRVMLTKDAASKFSELTHAPTIVKGAAAGQSFGSTAFASVNKAIADAGANTISSMYGGWYPTLSKAGKTQMANLLAGRVDGPGFLKAMQSAADAVAADSSVAKHQR